MQEMQFRHARFVQPIHSPLEDPYYPNFTLSRDSQPLYQNNAKNLNDQIPKIRTNIASIRNQLNKSMERTKERIYTDEQQANRSRISRFSSRANLQLDPMDEKVIIPFDSSYFYLMKKNNFQISFQPFQLQLRDWLVDISEIIISIAFNHLKKETIIEKQAKSFVCKNILQNIKIFFQRYGEIPLQDRYKLMKFINQQMYQIFDHIAKKYPLTSTRGVSKRIKSKIQKIDNRDSDQYDFLVNNNLNISYREDGDYSEDIMKIINKLISFTSEAFDSQMELQQTNYEIFTQIMEHIFDNANLQEVHLTAKEVVHIIGSKKRKIDKDITTLNRCLLKDDLLSQAQQRSSFENKRSSNILKDSQRQVLIGHKIPIGTPIFTDQDIQSSNFKSFDSSILRLLTKWAEELRNKIINAEQTILRRMFKFKNNKGRLINLEPIMKQYIYEAALDEIQSIEKYKKYLKDQNCYLQTVFSEQLNQAKYAKNDTRVGIYAAKLNEIASQYIFKYINRLIHSLLTIPKIAAAKITNDREKALVQSVNLITFKIGDIMRCKCSCSQQEFIKILSILDQLHINSPQLLKFVRIKNRLQTQNNDLLINLFFGNKAQCQLQLSVLSSQKKHEKNNSIFSHIIYEIQRAELGPISQMANITVQFDPLARQYSKKKGLRPQLIKPLTQEPNKKKIDQVLAERERFKKKMDIGTNIELPFVCCNCHELSIVNNPLFFNRNLPNLKGQCNKCINEVYDSICEKKQLSLIRQVLDYMYRQNTSDQDTITFYKNHIFHWDEQIFIKSLQEQTADTVMNKWFPPFGYIIRCKQKKPIFQLFTCIYQESYSYVLFAKINEYGQKKLLSVIKINAERQKKIQSIRKALQSFIIFQFKDTQTIIENDIKYFKCRRPNCCGIKINPGPIFERQAMIQYSHQKIVAKGFQYQQANLNMNYMKSSLQIVERYINSVKQKNVLWKIRNTIKIVQAFSCKLTNIKIVGTFVQLTDINIGQNPQIKSLKGIQSCQNLKFLDCKDCDLTNINELAKLKKLEQLNLTNNRRLDSIGSLIDHTQLINLYIRNTAVNSLEPLQKCLKLQSLDLQGCQQITTIKHITSKNLNYISIINCLNIQQFDLPSHVTKSLKNIEIYKTDIQSMMANFVADFSNKLGEEMKSSSEHIYNDQAINKINKMLKIRKTTSLLTN